MTMKTPEQIAHENIDDLGRSSLGRLFPVDHDQLLPIVIAAIEADRAQLRAILNLPDEAVGNFRDAGWNDAARVDMLREALEANA